LIKEFDETRPGLGHSFKEGVPGNRSSSATGTGALDFPGHRMRVDRSSEHSEVIRNG
jgi:hypothetical protein